MKIRLFFILGIILSLILFLGFETTGQKKSDILTVTPSERQVPGRGDMYIDTHNHLFGRMPSPSGLILDYAGAGRAAVAAMGKFGISKMFIIPPPFPINHPATHDIEDYMDTVRKYPGRFAFLGGGGKLNPIIQQAVHKGRTSPELRKRFEQNALELLSKGVLGFGEMSAEHLCLGKKHHHQEAPPDHPLFLLLADIAARHGVPIDIHMEAVPEAMQVPKRLSSFPNPKVLTPNIASFERLLAHNRKVRIIWAHVGWDNTGHRTAAHTADLLRRHPNLYMSFKISPLDSVPKNRPMERGTGLKIEWLKVIRKFSNRFLIGSDQFYVSPRGRRIGPPSAKPTNVFFSLLPPDLAHKLGYENPRRIFNLND